MTQLASKLAQARHVEKHTQKLIALCDEIDAVLRDIHWTSLLSSDKRAEIDRKLIASNIRSRELGSKPIPLTDDELRREVSEVLSELRPQGHIAFAEYQRRHQLYLRALNSLLDEYKDRSAALATHSEDLLEVSALLSVSADKFRAIAKRVDEVDQSNAGQRERALSDEFRRFAISTADLCAFMADTCKRNAIDNTKTALFLRGIRRAALAIGGDGPNQVAQTAEEFDQIGRANLEIKHKVAELNLRAAELDRSARAYDENATKELEELKKQP